ncbi:MAG: hypothetical protein ACYC4L_19015 [Chloroflexota bacterium]
MRVLLATVAMALVLVLGACSAPAGSTPTAAPATATKAQAAATAAATTKPAATAAAAAPVAAKLLTVADVEKATGLTGLKLIDKNAQTGAGGDVNVANKDGELILMLALSSSSAFDKMKDDKKYSTGPVSGVGEGAFGIPNTITNGAEPLGIAFRKGSQAATLSSFLDMNSAKMSKMLVPYDKMLELAKLVVSRM